MISDDTLHKAILGSMCQRPFKISREHCSEDKPVKFMVIGDVHGCYNELKLLVDYAKGTGCRVILAGDLFDRGTQNAEVAELVASAAYNEIELVLGNHEQMLLQYMYSDSKQGLYNGMDITVEQLSNKIGFDIKNIIPESVAGYGEGVNGSIHEFLYTLHTHPTIITKLLTKHPGTSVKYEIVKSLVVAHAAVYPHQGYQDNLWSRMDCGHAWDETDTVVTGHDPTPDALPKFVGRQIKIDTGCVYGGRLTGYVWPDHYFVYVDSKANAKWRAPWPSHLKSIKLS